MRSRERERERRIYKAKSAGRSRDRDSDGHKHRCSLSQSIVSKCSVWRMGYGNPPTVDGNRKRLAKANIAYIMCCLYSPKVAAKHQHERHGTRRIQKAIIHCSHLAWHPPPAGILHPDPGTPGTHPCHFVQIQRFTVGNLIEKASKCCSCRLTAFQWAHNWCTDCTRNERNAICQSLWKSSDVFKNLKNQEVISQL